jgi:hypothetical protein
MAVLYRDEKKDTAASDSLFRLILERYRATAQAKGAQKALGMEVTVKTREDSALGAYMDAETALWDRDEVKKAAAMFDSVSARYTEISFGPQAAYTSAWIYDEILNDSLQAYKKYEAVYKKWEATEYAAAAKRKLTAVIQQEETPEEKPGPDGSAPVKEWTTQENKSVKEKKSIEE